MATGLIALLDDVAALAKVAAASLDDTALAAARAGVKAAGVVIDDAAVTPRYVTGFSAARELPIVAKIALGSVRNKLLYLLPVALVLSAVAPWAITPLLMAGGAYLCFEGAEKIVEALERLSVRWTHLTDKTSPFLQRGEAFSQSRKSATSVENALAEHGGHAEAAPAPIDAATFERQTVSGAIRTDLILSGEIMAITLDSVADQGLVARAIILAVVGLGITAGVYGAVALIVKADDLGVLMARTSFGLLRLVGRGLVVGMPVFLRVLGVVGTAAMLWVGGGIVLHGFAGYGLGQPADLIHAGASAAGRTGGPIVEWLVAAAGAGAVGILLGGAIVAIAALVRRVLRRA